MEEPTVGRVLLADDDPGFREMTRLLLVRQGYHCDAVGSGQEVEALLREREYDLLISDVEMPGNRELRLIAQLPQLQSGLPVIVVTGAPSVESAVRSVGLAVAAYLVKPLEPRSFVDEVERAIGGYRCYRAVAGTRRRAEQLSEELERIEQVLRQSGMRGMEGSARAYVELTVRNAVESIVAVKHAFEVVRTGARDATEQRPVVLVQALWETIAVLEKTKDSFRSKELARLRRRLEELVGSPGNRGDDVPPAG